MRIKFWHTAVGTGFLTLSLAVAGGADLPRAGKTAPVWKGKTVAGKPISSAEFKGKVVLVNFFSYGCSECHLEYPHLQEFQKKYGSRGFSVVSVSADPKVAEAGAFAKEVKATFPVVHDASSKMTDAFGVLPLPANVVVDRSGKVVYSGEGANLAALQSAIEKAIGK